jgi:hypothetical protein
MRWSLNYLLETPLVGSHAARALEDRDIVSHHPTDRLIRESIRTRRSTTDDEITQIVERMATAPFDARILPVPTGLRGMAYLGRALGARDTALFIHLVQRVVADEQWSGGTVESGYLADLSRAVRHRSARLLVYHRRGGPVAATLTPTDQVLMARRRGPEALPLLYVVYAADRGMLTSGYQASSTQTLSILDDAQWLK